MRKRNSWRERPRNRTSSDDAETGTTVIASGKARLTEENLWADTQKITERYRGAKESPAYIKRMRENKESRVLVIVKSEKIISWGR